VDNQKVSRDKEESGIKEKGGKEMSREKRGHVNEQK
jgi:hypothetical protein